MICPRCYSGSVLEAWDEAPEDAVHWLKCMSCSHRWDAEPESMLSIFDAAIAKVEDDKQILERAREIIERLNA